MLCVIITIVHNLNINEGITIQIAVKVEAKYSDCLYVHHLMMDTLKFEVNAYILKEKSKLVT